MKLVKLEDVCYNGSSSLSQKDIIMLEGKYPVYGASGLIKYINFYKYDKEYIAIVKDGAGIGRTMILPANSSVISTLQYIFPKENINIRYLYYALNAMDLSKYYSGVTIPHIYFKDYKKEELYLPIIDEQINIVNKLDKIREIIDIRKKQIEELDELIKSQFVELFGSPFCNEKWEIKKIGNMAEIISDGNNIETKYYQETGDVLFLRIQNVWRNEFRLDDSVYVSKEVNDMYLDTSLHTGDILISKIGRYYTKNSSLGRVSLYRGENDKANYSNNIMRIRLKPEYNSEFVNIVLNLEDYQQHIRRESKGGTDKRALSKKIIENFEIINPPIKLQNEYVEKVKIIDKQKFEIQKNLEEMQKLQESLMNKYFG